MKKLNNVKSVATGITKSAVDMISSAAIGAGAGFGVKSAINVGLNLLDKKTGHAVEVTKGRVFKRTEVVNSVTGRPATLPSKNQLLAKSIAVNGSSAAVGTLTGAKTYSLFADNSAKTTCKPKSKKLQSMFEADAEIADLDGTPDACAE